MRQARRARDGRWFMTEKRGGVCRLSAPSWEPDVQGRWPLVDMEVRSLGEGISCPGCGATYAFEEMDCIFGTARKSGNDLLVLTRCTRCRLPHRLRGVGLVTAYPHLVRKMAGWSNWRTRRHSFDTLEKRLYGEGVGGNPTP